MKLVNEYLLLARDASVDANDQTVTLYKLIDNFTFGYKQQEFDSMQRANPGQPIVFPIPHTIASSWRVEGRPKGDTPFSLQTKLIDPDGETLSENAQEAVVPKGNEKVRFNINSPAMAVSGEGSYHYHVSAVDDNGNELATADVAFQVHLTPEA